MEQTKQLAKITDDYTKLLEGASKVSTIKESDELKVKALGYWKELQRQLNRAYREMLEITRETRARVVDEGYKATMAALHAPSEKPVTEKAKTVKKSSKKSKK